VVGPGRRDGSPTKSSPRSTWCRPCCWPWWVPGRWRCWASARSA